MLQDLLLVAEAGNVLQMRNGPKDLCDDVDSLRDLVLNGDMPDYELAAFAMRNFRNCKGKPQPQARATRAPTGNQKPLPQAKDDMTCPNYCKSAIIARVHEAQSKFERPKALYLQRKK